MHKKIKEFFLVYRTLWPHVFLFGLLPMTLKFVLDCLGTIGFEMEHRYLHARYLSWLQASAVIDNATVLVIETELEYHEEYAASHSLQLISCAWPTLNILLLFLFLIFTAFANEFYHVTVRCYGRFFAYCIKSDLQRAFCAKKVREPPTIKVTSEPYERRLAFCGSARQQLGTETDSSDFYTSAVSRQESASMVQTETTGKTHSQGT